MLKERLTRAVKDALSAARTEDLLPDVGAPVDVVSHARSYRTGVPLLLARRSENSSSSTGARAGVYAEHLAERINAHTDAPVVFAEPMADGALALTPSPALYAEALQTIADAGAAWGTAKTGAGKRALVEFVSANPNGPITIQHARGAVLGDAIARLLESSGYSVEREFYVNDAASAPQLRSLARVVFGAYRERFGAPGIAGADDAYSGEYVSEIAAKIAERDGDRYVGLSPEAAATAFTPLVVAAIRDAQEATLAAFGVRFDRWFSEASLLAEGALQKVLDTLMSTGHAYAQGGALWLKTTAFGDEGDRVLLRNDGTPSYFAGDLAYHADKLQHRSYDLAVDVWNTDHQPYIERTRAGLSALGVSDVSERLQIAVFGPVRPIQDGMELRTGRQAAGLVTLDEILSASGDRDALRFALLSATPAAAAVNLNLDSLANGGALAPVRAALQRLSPYRDAAPANLAGLAEIAEAQHLIRLLDRFPETATEATQTATPSLVTAYVTELSAALNNVGAGDDPASALLLAAARQTLVNALSLLGIGAE